MQNTIVKEFDGNPYVVTLIFDQGGQYDETRDWLEPFLDGPLAETARSTIGKGFGRIDKMVEVGLIAEVERLMQKGYAWNLPSMTSLGYLQVGKYLRDEITFRK